MRDVCAVCGEWAERHPNERADCRSFRAGATVDEATHVPFGGIADVGEVTAYNAWKSACAEMTTAKAAYDASTVKVRDALQKLAEFATPKP